MKVVNKIENDQCGEILRDPERVNYIKNAELIGSGNEEAFDRLTFLASKLLDVPLTMVSFVGEKSQYFKSFHGLPEPWCSEREIPIDVSVCQYTLVGDILSLQDVREYPLLASNPAVPALNLVGYLGVPLLTKEGINLGAFCAISDKARVWSQTDIEILKTLTKSIMSEIELKLSVRKLSKEREDWEKTVSMLLHDLRGPLGTIHGWAELGQMDGNTPGLEQEAFSSITQCAGEGIKIVDNILNWKLSNLNEDKNLKRENFEINADLIKFLTGIEKIKKVNFKHNLRDRSYRIFGHRDSVLRATTNLVQNAIKYGDISRPISIEVEQGKSHVFIKVHNFGNPIPKEELKQIFQFSYRSSAPDNSAKEGWGVGLYLVDSVAKAHKGDVFVKSERSEGTEFMFSISNNA